VFLEKDANAAALAEFRYGKNCGVANMLYITVSTGVGGGLILNGEPWRGAYGTAGEFGHMTIDFEGPLCSCGNRGCIQKVASGPNIAAWVLSQISAGETSLVSDAVENGAVSGRDVVRAAINGDEVSIAALDRAGRAVGFGIVSLAHLVNVELVVVGGGITNAGALLLDPIMQTVSSHVLGSTASSLRVVPWLIGEEVGVLGAVASAYSRMGSV
jgi:glucokinase